jgi:hypothetical protein
LIQQTLIFKENYRDKVLQVNSFYCWLKRRKKSFI